VISVNVRLSSPCAFGVEMSRQMIAIAKFDNPSDYTGNSVDHRIQFSIKLQNIEIATIFLEDMSRTIVGNL